MGQRLSIKVLDLLNAGCTIKQVISHTPADDAGEAFDSASLHVLFPSFGPLGFVVFDFEVFGDAMNATCDYNSWGDRVKTLAGVLARLAIPHEVF